MTATSKDPICLRCEHPKSEHANGGCNHLTDLGPQSHGNPESQACECTGFWRPRNVMLLR